MDSDHPIPSRLEAISTRWTLLKQAHAGSTFSSTEARNTLVLRYLPAVRRYVGVMMQGDDAAADVTQDILVRLLDGDFAGADPGRGRFRDLLKVAIRNMVRNDWARQKRRRPVAMDVSELAAEASDPDDGVWLNAWRKSVLDLVWNALEQQQRQQPGSVAYTLMRLRIDHPDDTSEQLAERLSSQLGRPVRADALRQKLRRARLEFVDRLLAEVGNALADPTPDKIEDELAALGLLEFVRGLLPADRRHGTNGEMA